MTPDHIGPYAIRAELGRGGMAVVYKAWDPMHRREVALKVLHPHLALEQGFMTRFLREGKGVARLHHPNIVRVYETGRAGEHHFIALEYIEGGTLLDRIAQHHGRLPPEDILNITAQIAEALDYAHAAGFFHRDIKASNILVEEDGHAFLSDFGIAKRVTGDSASLTLAGHTVGTPAYMAPEQLQDDRDVDARADIYSLGVVAFVMLTGSLPFQAENTFALIRKICEEPPPPVDLANPALTPAARRVFDKVLAKQPEERYQSAREFALALAAPGNWSPRSSVQPTIPLTRNSSGAPALPISVMASSELAPSDPRGSGRQRVQRAGRAGWLVAGTAGLLVVAVGVVIALNRPAGGASDGRTSPPAPAVAASTLASRAITSTLPPATPGVPTAIPTEIPATPSPSPTRTATEPLAAGTSAPTVENLSPELMRSLAPFVDPAGHYSLYVPLAWTQTHDELGTNFDAPDGSARIFVHYVAGLPEDARPADVSATYLKLARAMFRDIEVTGSRDVTLGALPAQELNLTGQILGFPVLARLLAVNDGSRAFVVASVVKPEQAGALQSSLDLILNSFRILPLRVVEVSVTPTRARSSVATPRPAPRASPASKPATTRSAAASPTAQPQGPAVISGRVVYAAWDAGANTYKLLLQDLDGRPPGLLYQGAVQPDFCRRPAKRIIANGLVPGVEGTIAIDIGGGVREVIPHTGDSLPACAPEGQRVVFQSDREGTGTAIWIHGDINKDVDSASYKLGPSFLGEYPTWSSRWQIIWRACAYWSGNGGACGIWQIPDRGRGNPVRLSSDGSDTAPDASPSGLTVAYMSHKTGKWQVLVVPASGGQAQQLTTDGDNGLPTWSPDGNSIAYVSNPEGGWALWVMNADGGSQRKVATLDGGFGRGFLDWTNQRISWGE